MATGQTTKVERTCQTCGIAFWKDADRIKAYGGKYCSVLCARRAPRPSKKIECACLTCGKAFRLFPSMIRKGRGQFCSLKCVRRPPRPSTARPRACEVCGTTFLVKPKDINRGGGKYCGRACYVKSMHIPLGRQFLERINTEAEGECILWVGNSSINGYGLLTVRTKETKRQVLAHRYAFEMAHGPIPEGMHVLHRCDVRACISPLHLFLGTPADNAADKVSKGRQVKGEHCNLAKLTADQVRAIRTRYAAGGITQKQLAAEYDTSLGNICAIIARRNWKHTY